MNDFSPQECPLVNAIEKNDIQNVEALLLNGHNPNAHSSCATEQYIDKEAQAPIFRAIELNHTEALRLLLRHGADPNVKRSQVGPQGQDHTTPFLMAIYLRHRDSLDLLIHALYRPNYKF